MISLRVTYNKYTAYSCLNKLDTWPLIAISLIVYTLNMCYVCKYDACNAHIAFRYNRCMSAAWTKRPWMAVRYSWFARRELQLWHIAFVWRLMCWFGVRWRVQRDVMCIVNCTTPWINRNTNAYCALGMFTKECMIHCQWSMFANGMYRAIASLVNVAYDFEMFALDMYDELPHERAACLHAQCVLNIDIQSCW